MGQTLFGLFVVMALAFYWNRLTIRHFEKYRRHANERIAHLEKTMQEHGWELPTLSFEFSEIDSTE